MSSWKSFSPGCGQSSAGATPPAAGPGGGRPGRPLRGPQPVVGDDPAGASAPRPARWPAPSSRCPLRPTCRRRDALPRRRRTGLLRRRSRRPGHLRLGRRRPGGGLAGAVDADTVGLTGSFCAIAETGNLVLLSGRGPRPASVCCRKPTWPSSLPTASWPPLEDAFACCAGRGGEIPAPQSDFRAVPHRRHRADHRPRRPRPAAGPSGGGGLDRHPPAAGWRGGQASVPVRKGAAAGGRPAVAKTRPASRAAVMLRVSTRRKGRYQ